VRPTGLRFRNLDVSPDEPVEDWPFEGILAAIERGTLPDWIRLGAAIAADPWGEVDDHLSISAAVPWRREMARLSTYCSGAVTPSAALMIRMRRVADCRPFA
jgi:hypothetical protein